ESIGGGCAGGMRVGSSEAGNDSRCDDLCAARAGPSGFSDGGSCTVDAALGNDGGGGASGCTFCDGGRGCWPADAIAWGRAETVGSGSAPRKPCDDGGSGSGTGDG